MGSTIQYDLNKKNKFLLLYSINNDRSTLRNIVDNFMLVNYRNFLRGDKDFRILENDMLLFDYKYGNWSDEFLINTSILYTTSKDFYSSNTIINQNYNQTNQVLFSDRSITNLNISVDRFIKKVTSNLKMKGSLSQVQSKNIVNSQLRDVISNSFTYGFEFRSVFTKGINFHLGSEWNTSIVKTTIKNKNTSNTAFLDFSYFPNEKFSFFVKNERYYFNGLSSEKNTFLFMDLDVKYILKKNKITLNLSIQNILNTNTYSNLSVTDTNIYKSNYRLIQRYVFLKLDYRF